PRSISRSSSTPPSLDTAPPSKLTCSARRLGLLDRVAKVVADPRDPTRIVHSLASMLKQRVYGLCLGYEDLNDHAQLREDLLLQSAVERDRPLASSATLCRLENRATRTAAWAMHEVIVSSSLPRLRSLRAI